ncbi:MAG: hypothetical protein K2P81_05460 [Bacteriovoracaceae bacterium]|nr:hypothetical protein [Bacteriovoracaceae bacterium]
MKRAPFWLLAFVTTTALAGDIRPILRETIDSLSTDNCVAKMSKVETTMAKLSAQDFIEELSQTKPEILAKELWDFKLKVHGLLRSFHQNKKLDRDCANAYRGALRVVRYAEDMVQEHQFRNNPTGISFPNSAFEEGNPHVRRNPKYENFNLQKDLQTGDLILSRGNAYTSAAIASLGEFDTQFSHLSVVYVDENKKIWTVEAHIEVGSFVRPLEDHIKDSNFRSMIFRFDDPEIAKRAGTYAYERVKKASDTKGNILYDFAFSMADGGEKLFCSEVASNAYEVASSKTVMMPMFQSRLLLRKESFVRDIGIESNESFIPADMEIDPRFEVVAEWRDAARVSDNLQKDAVLQAMFAWVDLYDYKMVQGSSKNSFLYRNVAWPLRRVPFLKKYFVKKLPLNMSRKLIGYFGVLESIGELLHEELKVADQKAIAERGLPLIRQEMYQVLDEVRLKDLGAKKKKLHKMFHPVKSKGE